MAKKSFYEVGSYTGDLQEGTDFFVRRQMRYLGENANFKPFLNTPIKELEQQLKESKAAEKKIFTEVETAQRWLLGDQQPGLQNDFQHHQV